MTVSPSSNTEVKEELTAPDPPGVATTLCASFRLLPWVTHSYTSLRKLGLPSKLAA